MKALSVSLRMQQPSQVEGGVLKSPEPARYHSDGFLHLIGASYQTLG